MFLLCEVVYSFVTVGPSPPLSAGSISADHVLRVLESMLKRALQVHPMRTAWVVMEAELLTGGCV